MEVAFHGPLSGFRDNVLLDMSMCIFVDVHIHLCICMYMI